MRFPKELYQMQRQIAQHFSNLRPAQILGLTLWVYGTILAKSGCQNAVIAALLTMGGYHCLRQRLREWLYDGKDKAATCKTQVEVQLCFQPLMRWVMALWKSSSLSLGIDVTLHKDILAVLTIRVLYRGCAIPVAWKILPANKKGKWMPEILGLLKKIKPAIPTQMQVVVMADRGLWSPALWHQIRKLSWHPMIRIQTRSFFKPKGHKRCQALELIPGQGYAWIGKGLAFKNVKIKATLIVLWDNGQEEPWVILTDLNPKEVGLFWYGLRVWIELGFRAIKGIGFQWQKTRRTAPNRADRHWLVLAIAMLWVLAYGSRVEDAQRQAIAPAHLFIPPKNTLNRGRLTGKIRLISIFSLGWNWLHKTLIRGYLWTRLWLVPEPWPQVTAQMKITYHGIS